MSKRSQIGQGWNFFGLLFDVLGGLFRFLRTGGRAYGKATSRFPFLMLSLLVLAAIGVGYVCRNSPNLGAILQTLGNSSDGDFASSEPSGGGTFQAQDLPSTPSEKVCPRYVVKTGDTLIGISAKFFVRMDDLAAANGIVGPKFTIYVGQELIIPC